MSGVRADTAGGATTGRAPVQLPSLIGAGRVVVGKAFRDWCELSARVNLAEVAAIARGTEDPHAATRQAPAGGLAGICHRDASDLLDLARDALRAGPEGRPLAADLLKRAEHHQAGFIAVLERAFGENEDHVPGRFSDADAPDAVRIFYEQGALFDVGPQVQEEQLHAARTLWHEIADLRAQIDMDGEPASIRAERTAWEQRCLLDQVSAQMRDALVAGRGAAALQLGDLAYEALGREDQRQRLGRLDGEDAALLKRLVRAEASLGRSICPLSVIDEDGPAGALALAASDRAPESDGARRLRLSARAPAVTFTDHPRIDDYPTWVQEIWNHLACTSPRRRDENAITLPVSVDLLAELARRFGRRAEVLLAPRHKSPLGLHLSAHDGVRAVRIRSVAPANEAAVEEVRRRGILRGRAGRSIPSPLGTPVLVTGVMSSPRPEAALSELIGPEQCEHPQGTWSPNAAGDALVLSCPRCERDPVVALPLHQVPADHPAREAMLARPEWYLARQTFYDHLAGVAPAPSLEALLERDQPLEMDRATYRVGPAPLVRREIVGLRESLSARRLPLPAGR